MTEYTKKEENLLEQDYADACPECGAVVFEWWDQCQECDGTGSVQQSWDEMVGGSDD